MVLVVVKRFILFGLSFLVALAEKWAQIALFAVQFSQTVNSHSQIVKSQ